MNSDNKIATLVKALTPFADLLENPRDGLPTSMLLDVQTEDVAFAKDVIFNLEQKPVAVEDLESWEQGAIDDVFRILRRATGDKYYPTEDDATKELEASLIKFIIGNRE